MTDSPEHQFISESLHAALQSYSETRLLGLKEAERRTFDYGCLLLHDASRPLVSQVLWSHEHGIEKDIRTLLFDGGSSLRLYFLRDRVRNRAKVDEVLRSFREREETRGLLRGLRLIPVPDGFDADSAEHQEWMNNHILDRISNDLLFAVVFGKLTSLDVRRFSQHGGPSGLKFAALQVIAEEGLHHGPTFEQRLGIRGSPLREAIAMLTGAGFVASPGGSIVRAPTLKGRFLLDLARRISFEKTQGSAWSAELIRILHHLQIEPPDHADEQGYSPGCRDIVLELLHSMAWSRNQFGVDLMAGVDLSDPKFHSDLDWKYFTSERFRSADGSLWDDPDDLAALPWAGG